MSNCLVHSPNHSLSAYFLTRFLAHALTSSLPRSLAHFLAFLLVHLFSHPLTRSLALIDLCVCLPACLCMSAPRQVLSFMWLRTTMNYQVSTLYRLSYIHVELAIYAMNYQVSAFVVL